VRSCQAAHCVIPSTRSFPCTPKIHRSRKTGHKGIAPTANIYSPESYIHYDPGPTCRGSVPLCMPPFNYKRGGMRRYGDQSSDSKYITQWSRVLRPGGPNQSKPSCALVCSSTNLVTSKTLRPLLILGIRAGAIRHPAGEIYPPTFGAPGRGLGLKFLLVPSLSMMVRIIEHRAETSEDLAMEQEVASSAPRVPDRPESGAAVVHVVQQHTPAQVSRTPSRATPTALSTARELLRHLPSSTASPGAMKQWCDDIDRLLGMAHSTSTRSRPRSSQRQREATASVRSPSVRGAQTDNLRAELNRRCTGEDARISLERARERHQNIEGCNLDQDFTAATLQTPMGTRSQTGDPLAGVGCAALADHLCAAAQVLAAPAEKIRWDIKPVGVPAGVRHRHHGSRWKHCCDGNVFSCRLV
jgi:hypothetical protein